MAAASAKPTPLTSVDGEIMPSAEASVAASDDGLLRGDGVFEVAKLYAGRPFALGDHLDRLESSAGAIELSVERARLEQELSALITRAGAVDAVLRIVLTRAGRRLAMVEPLPAWEPTIKVATVTYSPTPILTGVKSISYAANMQATRIAKGQGADEAIFVRPDGVVLEAPTSAVFWASDGVLHTPSLDCGILASITRARLLDALEISEGIYGPEHLRGADEAFLASTTREVQAISSVDGIPLSQTPGPLSSAASAAFERVVAAELG